MQTTVRDLNHFYWFRSFGLLCNRKPLLFAVKWSCFEHYIAVDVDLFLKETKVSTGAVWVNCCVSIIHHIFLCDLICIMYKYPLLFGRLSCAIQPWLIMCITCNIIFALLFFLIWLKIIENINGFSNSISENVIQFTEKLGIT